MKCISLWQPWGTLVVNGSKKFETRHWATNVRGVIAIHAAKAFPGSAKSIAESEPFRSALGWPDLVEGRMQEWLDSIALAMKALPLGQVIATANLVNCLEVDLIPRFVQPFTAQECAFGNYAPGRFGFLLDDIKLLRTPIPAKGALGLWDWKEWEAAA